MPSLAVLGGLAGMNTAGSARIDVTATGDLYQPTVKLDLAGRDITADNFGVGSLGTAVDLGFLGPLDQGYAGVAVTAEGGADAVTMDGAAMPAAGAPRWSLAARVPATGEARIERLELTADALTARATAAIDQQTMAGKGRLDVDAPDLARLLASLGTLAPPGLPLAGGLELGADAAIEPGAERITVDLTGDGSNLAGLRRGRRSSSARRPGWSPRPSSSRAGRPASRGCR